MAANARACRALIAVGRGEFRGNVNPASLVAVLAFLRPPGGQSVGATSVAVRGR
ncbi:hypothetical protein [Hyphobacterium sp. CCMP332]|uniref:hypothetical protein n=1 Tax=Hyphobacterium sp. CCMP332 TaxID=2749086 RepID=UPI001F24B6FE|nr:hypothetical protein [Hyphobacterium sp. CCMP332]